MFTVCKSCNTIFLRVFVFPLLWNVVLQRDAGGRASISAIKNNGHVVQGEIFEAEVIGVKTLGLQTQS